jgi:hypothetical protein
MTSDCPPPSPELEGRSADTPPAAAARGATYTPGWIGTKILAVILGVLIMLAGIAWLARPTRLLLTGVAAEAEVVRVEILKPGQDPVALTTNKAVAATEDHTRNGVFTYRVRFPGPGGETVSAVYDVGHVVRAQYRIGDTLELRYDPDEPTDLTAPGDIATWTFGGFFFVIGLIIAVTQSWVLLYAHRPIELDPLDVVIDDPNQPAPSDNASIDAAHDASDRDPSKKS